MKALCSCFEGEGGEELVAWVLNLKRTLVGLGSEETGGGGDAHNFHFSAVGFHGSAAITTALQVDFLALVIILILLWLPLAI